MPRHTLFQFMIALAYTGKNLYLLLESPDSPVGISKDTAYHLLNSVTARRAKNFYGIIIRYAT